MLTVLYSFSIPDAHVRSSRARGRVGLAAYWQARDLRIKGRLWHALEGAKEIKVKYGDSYLVAIWQLGGIAIENYLAGIQSATRVLVIECIEKR